MKELGGDEDLIVDGAGGAGDEYEPPGTPRPRPKFVVAEDVPVYIRHEWEQFLDSNGRLITESFVRFSRDNLRQVYQSLDSFLQRWGAVDRKEIIIAELLQHGIWLDKLQEEFGAELDAFDLICHVAFDVPMMTRQERSRRVKDKGAWADSPAMVQRVLQALLDKYAVEGIEAIERAADGRTMSKYLALPPFPTIGAPIEIVRAFGGKAKYQTAVRQLEREIYTITPS